jgi:isovaleryl-CoA dehydrogenase
MLRLVTQTLRRFSTNDFHHIANFDPELQDLQKVVRKFAVEKVAPLADKVDREDKFPHHLWREFGEMGLLGVTTPA